MKISDEDEKLLAMSVDELYVKLGESFSDSTPTERGIKDVFNSLRKLGVDKYDEVDARIKSAICRKEVFEKLTSESDNRTVFLVVLDGLVSSSLDTAYPLSTLSALIVKIGVNRICRRVVIE